MDRLATFAALLSDFRRGDVRYGRLGPYLNKVWVAAFDGLCSAEFLVFPARAELSRRRETPHFRRFKYSEIIGRDKVNLDIQWSPSVADPPKSDTPQTLMQEILEELAQAMREFADVESEIRHS